MDTHTEDAVIESVGLPRKALREFVKEMKLGEHYQVGAGNVLAFTGEGLEWLEKKIGAKKKRVRRAVEKIEYAKLVVVGIPRNPRMLMCAKKAGEPGTERVRVKAQRNFMVGMELEQCRRMGPDHWAYEGPQPRFRGRF